MLEYRPNHACAPSARLGDKIHRPDPARHAVYNQLYALHMQVHDAFGGVNKSADLSRVMKDLPTLKETSRTRT